MLRPTGPRRQSNPQPSKFEAALRHNEPLLPATNVTISSGKETEAVAITGAPRVPPADPDREVIWKVGVSAVRFNLSALLAKPEVTKNTELNSTNAVVHSMGATLCMLARSAASRSRFLFSADRAGTYSVALTISSIDIEPWARRSSKLAAGDAAAKQGVRDAIEASPRLEAGAGINIRDAPEGRKLVAVTNPRPQAGRDLSAADKFAQRALDPDREWSLEAIQKSDPHVVQMEYNARTRTYQGTFPISADGAVTGRLDYVLTRTSGNVDAGKFLVTTYPDDSSRTLANLFDAGTVDALILQSGGSAEAAVTDRKFTAEVVKDTRNTNTLAFVSKTAQVHNPSPMGTDGDTAYVRINFRLTDGVVTGWNRDSSKDVDGAELGAARRGITPGGLAIVQNHVLLVGDRYSGNVYGFRKGHRFSGADITTGIGFSSVNGMAYNRTGNKLAITQGGYRETIKVFKLKDPGTANQELGEETNDTISGDKLVAGVPFALWCMAWHDNDDEDLWVIDRKGFARVFRGGNHVGSKDLKLPGTEQVYAATLVGDVLIYGGGGAAVYAYNVVTDERVPGLELTGSQVGAGLPGFGLLCAEYDHDADILYLGGWGVHLAAFTATKAVTAYPEASLYGYRTMSKARLQAETLDAPAGDAERSFNVVVSERQPAAVRLETLTFEEDDTDQSLYEVEEPFTGITSIAFDARTGDQQYKYQVRMPSGAAQGGGIPVAMKVGSLDYSLAPSSLGGGDVAVFVTPAVASAARVSDSTLKRQIDVRYANGSWANGVVASEPRTLTNTQLKHALGAPHNVAAFPADPALGQRVNLVRQVTITGWGILSAELTASANFAGWYHGPSPAGALAGAPGNDIVVLGSFLHGTGQRANKAVVERASDSTQTPQYVWVNGRRHGVASIGNNSWTIDGLDGSSFVAGQDYAVQVEWTDGPAYPPRTFAPGDYTWNGSRWVLSPETTTRPQDLALDAGSAVAAGKVFAIAADTEEFTLVPGADPVAQAGNTERWPLAKVPIVKMTQAQYDAATAAGTISQNILYVIVG